MYTQGLLFVALPVVACSTHQRDIISPRGREEYQFVADGNLMASRVSLLIYYSLARNCRWLLEQPQGSAAELYPRLQEIFSRYDIFKAGIWGGAYADAKDTATPKRHWLYSNDEMLLRRLSLAAGVLSKEELAEFGGEPTMKKSRKGEKDTYTGVKANLEASGCPSCTFVLWLIRSQNEWVQPMSWLHMFILT